MKKSTLVILTVLVTFVFAISIYIQGLKIVQNTDFDGKNTSFNLDDENISLIHGMYRSTSTNEAVRYIGNETYGDVNDDTLDDIAFVVTKQSTEYYILVALKTDDGYKITNAYFVGDGIVPLAMEIYPMQSELSVHYHDIKTKESKRLKLKIQDDSLLKID